MMSESTKSIIGPIHQQYYCGYKQHTKNNKFCLQTDQQKYSQNSSIDQWRPVKCVEDPADIGSRGMSIECLKEFGWLSELTWLQTDEERWPKPWC